jgi:hypothetical protein
MGVSLFIPLAIYAVAYGIGALAALGLSNETRQRPLLDVMPE